jgi:hypothetical protein
MLRAAFALAIVLLPLAALAQSYRCVGTDGKKYYGSSVPPQCLGQPVEQLDSRGVVVKRIDAAASADERAKKDADEADRKKRETLAKEQGRKDSALMASYTSEKDIDVARGRALEGTKGPPRTSKRGLPRSRSAAARRTRTSRRSTRPEGAGRRARGEEEGHRRDQREVRRRQEALHRDQQGGK